MCTILKIVFAEVTCKTQLLENHCFTDGSLHLLVWINTHQSPVEVSEMTTLATDSPSHWAWLHSPSVCTLAAPVAAAAVVVVGTLTVVVAAVVTDGVAGYAQEAVVGRQGLGLLD